MRVAATAALDSASRLD
jgi:hypothetical protein